MGQERPPGEGQTPGSGLLQPSQAVQLITKIPHVLPHERVFPIQIGSELFKLSGASLSSDAPSYFSQYFQCQIKTAEEKGEDAASAIRTLYIDRDPSTFKDIALHLQGYHVQPRDGTHFVRLFADAQFYSLPKLISQLYEESIFMSIGHREFQIPRDLFQDPGNSPNFFTLGFAIFFSSPEDLFPGLDRKDLIRPPSIMPPSVPQRSADTFQEILHLLRGYPVNIRDDAHRQELLRDCRYFNFKGLEQRLIPHAISHNQARGRDEIVLRVEDILKSGISIAPEPHPADPLSAWITYARPYIGENPAELVLEIGRETTRLHLPAGAVGIAGSATDPATLVMPARAEFFRDVRTRIARLFEVISTKLNLPLIAQPPGLLAGKGGASSQPPTPGNTPISDDLVRVVIEPETAITLDGRPYTAHCDALDRHFQASATISADYAAAPTSSSAGGSAVDPAALASPVRKRRRLGLGPWVGLSGGDEWVVRTGQWRLRIQSSRAGKSPIECVLVAVRLDAFSSEHSRNAQRGFLAGT
ncbi:hypothetical protein GGTG_11054 [Gaeumannomyces tritici R3-111a-1]|uniref:Potassium channel tetramerisation-type BTB domain-containing protein n=1 Tax=Gaeumannomyces tritici (strain R3-111a-1) TaxID=644352 RepID=J3PC31_GAET3|nr:hypothetical protein GGTG_11054 [Gaeumannomyces tritici R3-111a-1]EJT71801.1 hypothetical protein GGTG_11054 [Gaeumannomyces tritici R3-111a-1]